MAGVFNRIRHPTSADDDDDDDSPHPVYNSWLVPPVLLPDTHPSSQTK